MQKRLGILMKVFALIMPIAIVLNAQADDKTCTCDASSNELKCPSSVSSETITCTVPKDGMVLQASDGNSITVSGGALKLIFGDDIKKLTTMTSISVSGGSMEVNWTEEKKDSSETSETITDTSSNSGAFILGQGGNNGSGSNDASLSITGGTFKSNHLKNLSNKNSANGGSTNDNASISITGGTFEVKHLSNGDESHKDTGITINNNGTLTAKTFENYGTVNLKGGTSTITSLINHNNINVNGRTNNFSFFTNDGTANIGNNATTQTKTTISNGTNTFGMLSNSGTLNISNGTNTITTFMNDKNGTITISGGSNNIKLQEKTSSTDSTAKSDSTASQPSTSNKSESDKSNSDKDDSKDNANPTQSSQFTNKGTLTISGGSNTIANFLNQGETTISGGSNSFDLLDNRSKLTFGNATTTREATSTTSNIATIKDSLLNYGTASVEVNQTIKLESTATFNNYGTLSGSGKIEGGVFNHNGKFSNVKGEMFSNLDFNNYTDLTIKTNSDSSGNGNSLDKLDVNNFANGGTLNLEGNLTTKGFENMMWSSFVVKSGGTLTINTGGKTTITCDNNSDLSCCKNGTSTSNGKTCEINASASNAAGFLTLESGGNVKSHIDFINSGYVTINGGTFEVTQNSTTSKDTKSSTSTDSTPKFKNQGGVIYLKSGTIKGDIDNSGKFSMYDGTIENTLTNHSSFTINGGTIKGTITNEGGVFTINGGTFGDSTATTSTTTTAESTFNNKVWEQTEDTSDTTASHDTAKKTYTEATLNIFGGNTSISSIKNESKTESAKTYKSVININGGSLKVTEKLENNGRIFAFSGSLNAEKLLQNNNGEITAYKGSTIKAKEFDWGNGTINFINGNSGYLNFECVKISGVSTTANTTCMTSTTQTTATTTAIVDNAKLNMDFSLSPLVFNKDYYIIQTQSCPSNLDKITIESNAKNNLAESAKNNLTFTTSYKNNNIVVTASIANANNSLESLLSKNALANLGEVKNQLDSIKNIDSSDVLAHIISNPLKVATELKNNNETIVKNHAKSTHATLATSLNTLNRLNKSSTPRKLAFSDVIRPTYNFALLGKKPKNPLIRFANFNQDEQSFEESPEDANDFEDSSDFEETFTLEDLAQEYEEEIENAKLKYNQLIDYDNNLYASLLAVFGSYGGSRINAYGFVTGYDIKVNDGLILGANFSYTNANKSHNIGFGGYGRTYIKNNEIDFGINFNVALSGYEYEFLGYKHKADFNSFGFSGNITYGYLFNVYKTQFFKPIAGINLYYANTPQYKENGKYAGHFYTQNSFEMSLDLGAEYRVFLKKNYYVFAQLKFEQFIVNASNGLFMRYGDGVKFNIAQYKGFRNYIQALVGGDFAIIKDTFNITANIGYKMAILKAKIDKKEVAENFTTVNVGVKYMF